MTVDQIPIGRFSVITRLTQKALRYYDTKKILVPKAKDGITGYRYYTGNQIQSGVKIKLLTGLGFSLDEIREYLDAEESGNKRLVERILEERRIEAESQLNSLRRVVSLLRTDQTVKKTMSEPVIKETQKLRVLSKRDYGRYDEAIGRMIGDIMNVVMSPENQRNFVRITGPFMTVYHGEEDAEKGADIEVAVPVTGKVYIDDPEVEIRNLQPARVVSTVHQGAYETISQAYEVIFRHIAEKGYEVAGPVMDIYLNDPNQVDPDDILTEIQVQIK